MPRPIVLCLPPAGAGPSLFQPWLDSSPEPEFRAVDLPGKERLFAEPLPHSVPQLVEAIRPALETAAGEADVLGLFGHCFGALVAYEAAQVLVRDGYVGGLVLFASGANPPGRFNAAPVTGLPDEEFIAGVRRIADYRHTALDDPELRELLLPALRADVAAHESYAPQWSAPLAHPIVAIRGTHDTLVPRDASLAWRELTSARFDLAEFPGRHMYLDDSWEHLIALMEKEIQL